jgi:hypothetical protein
MPRAMAPKKPAAKAASATEKPKAPHAGQFQKGKSGNPAGRPKGIVDRYSQMRGEERARIAASAGCTPLEFMLSVMLSDDEEMPVRLRAATDAAPYMHQKRAMKVEVEGQLGQQIDLASIASLPKDDRKTLLDILMRLGIAL